MATLMLSRNDFVSHLGLEDASNNYTPISIGKRNHTGNASNTFASTFFGKADFTNAEELRAIHLERFHPEQMFYVRNGQPVAVRNKMLVVGDETEGQFGVHSNRYTIVQNDVVTNAIAMAMDEFGIEMTGSVRVKGGRLYVYAYFKGLEYQPRVKNVGDIMAPGIYGYNSNDGSEKFGISAFLMRLICTNGMTARDTIGCEESKHFSCVEELANNYGHYMTSYVDKFDHLFDVFEGLRARMLTNEEQDALLLGIGLPSSNVDLMTRFRDGLNPEVAGQKEISAYDLYNVATAYISHRTSGANSLNATMSMFDKAEKILTARNLDKVMDKGFAIRRKIIESGVQSAPIEIVSEA